MAKSSKKGEDADLLRAALDDFQACEDAEATNRGTAIADIRFGRLGEQWPADIERERELEGKPCLTINKLPTYMRQVVNDARMNKPSVKVHAADSGADPETAELINGLIRNIEYSSNADAAYDTGAECAISGGFGYWRVSMDYAYDDAFDMDIFIKRVSNPFSIYGDPNSGEVDSSDWDVAFVVDQLSKTQFKRQWGNKSQVDWDDTTAWKGTGESWRQDTTVTVAEWWKREEIDRPIVLLSDGSVYDLEYMQSEQMQFLLQAGQIEVARERMAKSCKVTQRFMSGAEILETREWPGKYIPIIPVYGDEFDVEGKRYLRSLIYNSKDPQRMYNVWRSIAVETVGLAPKVPYIGAKGAFNTDQANWNTANRKNHPYLEYDPIAGQPPPQRQPLDMGRAAGAMQEALNASDDIKSTLGLFDASVGARSNETSGVAINARKVEGDVSTFHFSDNRNRAIRHTGRVLIDLIPKVYSEARMVRVIGEDGKQDKRQINKEYQKVDPKTGQPMQQPVMGANGQPMVGEDGNPLMKPIMALHDLNAGKYDLTVTPGPSFTSQREEAVDTMGKMVQAFPAAAPIILPELAKNFDWPGADKIADKLEALEQGTVPPQVQQAIEEGQKQMQQMGGEMLQLQEENQKLKQDKSEKYAEIEADAQVAAYKIDKEQETAKLKIEAEKNAAFYKSQSDTAASAAKTAETNKVPGGEKIMEGLATLGQLVADGQQAHAEQIQGLAKIMAAPSEIVRDPKTGRAAGSRKVMN